MKSSFLILRSVMIIFLLIMICSVQFPQGGKPYEFKTAHIKQNSTEKIAVGTVEKTKEIFISENGKKETIYITEKRNISMGSQNMNDVSHSVIIKDGDYIITYDPDKKTGTKIKNTFSDKFSGMSEDQIKKFAEGMGNATNTKVTKEGTEVINGLLCTKTTTVSDIMGMKTITTIWRYLNYVVKTISKGSSTDIKEEVTEFNEGVDIDPNVHKVPGDVKITTMSSPY